MRPHLLRPTGPLILLLAHALLVTSPLGCGQRASPASPTRFDPTPFTDARPNLPGSVQVTYSGEAVGPLTLHGAPQGEGSPYFVDGWQVTFDTYLISLGNLRLTRDPEASQDPSVLGPVVAQAPGPFLVDMAAASDFSQASGSGALLRWTHQDDGTPFARDGRYGFSFASRPATADMQVMGAVEPQQLAARAQMAAAGWTHYIAGTATFVGSGVHPDAAMQKRFAALPAQVPFVFGFNAAGNILNCRNPDLAGAHGLQATAAGAVNLQITAHVEHLFWDALGAESAPLRFDPIAAQASSLPGAPPLALHTLQQSLRATFSDGTPLPDRAPYITGLTVPTEQRGQVVYNTGSLPATAISNLADLMAFSVQAQLHLNGGGLCFIRGQHPGDPYLTPRLGG